MCFSAEVSFGAGVLLTVIGVASWKAALKPEQKFLSVLPLFYGLQQITEGVLWVYLGNNLEADAYVHTAQYLYLALAHFFFVTWIPLSILALEPIPWRRALLGCFLIIGLGIAILDRHMVLGYPIVAQIVGNSLQYPFEDPVRAVLYMIIVCGSPLLSSQPHVWLLGVLGIASIGLTYWLYWWTFTSVWCFAAAAVSILIYFILRDLNKKQAQP